MSFVPGDRQRFGLVLPFSLSDNLVLTQYDEPPYAKGINRDEHAIAEWASRAVEEYDIRTPSPDVPVSTLSGGNQQKAVVAREFSRDLSVLLLDKPTRGLTSAASNSSTSASSPSVTRERRCCSSRPSWTRSWSSPTASA